MKRSIHRVDSNSCPITSRTIGKLRALVAGIILLISVPFRERSSRSSSSPLSRSRFLGRAITSECLDAASKDRLAMAGGGGLELLTLMFFAQIPPYCKSEAHSIMFFTL